MLHDGHLSFCGSKDMKSHILWEQRSILPAVNGSDTVRPQYQCLIWIVDSGRYYVPELLGGIHQSCNQTNIVSNLFTFAHCYIAYAFLYVWLLPRLPLPLESGVGAGIDSYYEYLFKAFILLGEKVTIIELWWLLLFADIHS